MTLSRFDAQVLAVARAHGTVPAVDWSGLSRDQVVALRKRHDGYSRGRGHPTVAEIAAMAPRHACDCPRCDDWRAERDVERARIAAGMTDLIGTPDEWRLSAACLGEPPETFFGPDDAGPGSSSWVADAKAICARCPDDTRQACLDFALMTQAPGHEVGIFGGTSGRERKRMRQATRGGAA